MNPNYRPTHPALKLSKPVLTLPNGHTPQSWNKLIAEMVAGDDDTDETEDRFARRNSGDLSGCGETIEDLNA